MSGRRSKHGWRAHSRNNSRAGTVLRRTRAGDTVEVAADLTPVFRLWPRSAAARACGNETDGPGTCECGPVKADPVNGGSKTRTLLQRAYKGEQHEGSSYDAGAQHPRAKMGHWQILLVTKL